MAIEKNPNDITAPIDVAKDKLNTQSEALGIDVNINEEQEEDLAVNVDPMTGEVEMALNEDSGKMLASISEDFYTNLADLMEEDQLEEISNTVLDNYQSDKESREEYLTRIFTKPQDWKNDKNLEKFCVENNIFD